MYDLIIDGHIIMTKETSVAVLATMRTLSLAFIGLSYEVRNQAKVVLMKGILKSRRR